MTFELVRWGWSNTAAIVALAAMPIVALTTVPDQRPTQPSAAAAICLSAAECAVTATAAPEIAAE